MAQYFYSVIKSITNPGQLKIKIEGNYKVFVGNKSENDNVDIEEFVIGKLKNLGWYNPGDEIIDNTPRIKVMYHNSDLTELKISNNGNFVDLRSAEKISIKAGEFKLIDLGVSIKLPDGYWGQIVPRSSLFKNHGLIQTNSFGVVDTSYCGEDDHWMLPVYATRDTIVEFDERICQFRIVKDNNFIIDTVEHLEDNSRGGFGSSGKY